MSTVVVCDPTTVVLSNMTLVACSCWLADVTTVAESASWCRRCEPTPLPTAGVKIKSSSSLGSNSGLFLDRNAFALLRRLSLIALHTEDFQDRRGGCLVIFQRFCLGIDIGYHFVQTGCFSDDLVGSYRV